MTVFKSLMVAAALSAAPAITQAENWSYGSDVCKEDKTGCLTNFIQPMSIDFYLGGVMTLEELQALNENIELEPDMMIPARMWIRVS